MNTKKLDDELIEDILLVLDDLKEKIISGTITPKQCIHKVLNPETVQIGGIDTKLPVNLAIFYLEYTDSAQGEPWTK